VRLDEERERSNLPDARITNNFCPSLRSSTTTQNCTKEGAEAKRKLWCWIGIPREKV